MTPIKVLYIVPTVGIGGVETFIKHVSQHHNDGFQPSFLLFQTGPLSHWLEDREATVYYCPHKPRLSRPWTWWLYQKELLTLVQSNKIQLVHSSMAYAALFSWRVNTHAPHVWFQHGPVSGWMDTLAYKLPNKAVFYNSLHTYKKQGEHNPEALQSLNTHDFIVPLGTPSLQEGPSHTEDKKQWLAQHNLPEDTIVLSMANRLQRWKGVHIAVAAYKLLFKKTSRPTALFIYADSSWDASYEKELISAAKGLPVFFSKPLAELNRAFLFSDIVINASTTPEPFGLTLIEAMAASAIPVAPTHGGPVEILSSELAKCGFTPGSAESLSETLLHLVSNPDTLQKMKQLSFKRHQDNYTVEKMMKRLEECYLKLLAP